MPEIMSDDAHPDTSRSLAPYVPHAARAAMLDPVGVAPEEGLDWRR